MIEYLKNLIERLFEWIRNALKRKETPPPDDLPLVWDKYAPIGEWPSKFAGLPVGYVRVFEPKAPLFHMTKNPNTGKFTIPAIYQNEDLRDGKGTDAKRIIVHGPNYIMVRADGDDYHHGDPRPFNKEIDGSTPYYMVMHEQIIDGIKLWEHNLPELYISMKAVDEAFIN